jgi:hypothetical protein
VSIEWIIVKNSWTKKPIGAIGYIGSDLAVITAFYEDKDANKDGKVGLSERLFSFGSMKGAALAEVANHAYADPQVLMRDPAIYRLRGQLTVQFAAGLVSEGVYRVYFARGIGQLAGAIAGAATSNLVKSFVIKKGLEKAVEKAYHASVGV